MDFFLPADTQRRGRTTVGKMETHEEVPFELLVTTNFIGIELYVTPKGKGAFVGGFRQQPKRFGMSSETRGPAELSGLVRPGDLLLRANSIVVKDMKLTEIVQTITKLGRPVSLLLQHTSFLDPAMADMETFLKDSAQVEAYFRYIENKFEPRGTDRKEIAVMRDRLRFEQTKIMFLLEAIHYETINDASVRAQVAMKLHEKFFSSKSKFQLEKSIRVKGEVIISNSKIDAQTSTPMAGFNTSGWGMAGDGLHYRWATEKLMNPIVNDVKLSLIHLFCTFKQQYKRTARRSPTSMIEWSLQDVLKRRGWKSYFLTFLLQTRQHNSFLLWEAINKVCGSEGSDQYMGVNFEHHRTTINRRFVRPNAPCFVLCLGADLRRSLLGREQTKEGYLGLLSEAKEQIMAYLTQFLVGFQSNGLHTLMEEHKPPSTPISCTKLLQILRMKSMYGHGLSVKQVGRKDATLIPTAPRATPNAIMQGFFVMQQHHCDDEKTKIVPIFSSMNQPDVGGTYHNLDSFFLADKKLLRELDKQTLECFHFVLSGNYRSQIGGYTYATCLRYTTSVNIPTPLPALQKSRTSSVSTKAAHVQEDNDEAGRSGEPCAAARNEIELTEQRVRSFSSSVADQSSNHADTRGECSESKTPYGQSAVITTGVMLLSSAPSSIATLRPKMIRLFHESDSFRDLILKQKIQGEDIDALEQVLAGISSDVADDEGSSLLFRKRQEKLIYALLSPHLIARVVCHILLERKIVFVCSNKTTLVYVAEYFRSVLEPVLTWPHVYAPVLPDSMLTNLECPTPFIMGTVGHVRKHGLLFKLMKQDESMCIIDLNESTMFASHSAEKVITSMVASLSGDITTQIERESACEDNCTITDKTRRALHEIIGDTVLEVTRGYRDCTVEFETEDPKATEKGLMRKKKLKVGNVIVFDEVAYKKCHKKLMDVFLSSFVQTQLFSNLVTENYKV